MLAAGGFKVLVACEESQTVCKAFRALGIEAYSCDLQECSGGKPEWHIQDDVLKHLNNGWDKIISFQPCTDLAVSGAKHFESKRANGTQEKSIRFFFEIWKHSNCSENPIGILNGGEYVKQWYPELYEEMKLAGFPFRPTQIIQPWQFGDPFTKTTCLWLKGLPPLFPTQIVDKGEFIEFISKKGKKIRQPKWYAHAGLESIGNPDNDKRSRERSKTFPGIASAMAQQWNF